MKTNPDDTKMTADAEGTANSVLAPRQGQISRKDFLQRSIHALAYGGFLIAGGAMATTKIMASGCGARIGSSDSCTNDTCDVDSCDANYCNGTNTCTSDDSCIFSDSCAYNTCGTVVGGINSGNDSCNNVDTCTYSNYCNGTVDSCGGDQCSGTNTCIGDDSCTDGDSCDNNYCTTDACSPNDSCGAFNQCDTDSCSTDTCTQTNICMFVDSCTQSNHCGYDECQAPPSGGDECLTQDTCSTHNCTAVG